MSALVPMSRNLAHSLAMTSRQTLGHPWLVGLMRLLGVG